MIDGFASQVLKVAEVMDHGIGLEHETATAIHEMGHILGARDHYGGDYLTTDQANALMGALVFSETCIYGEGKENLTSNTICDGCKKVILGEIDFPEAP